MTYSLLLDGEELCWCFLGVHDTILPLSLIGALVGLSRLDLRNTGNRSSLLLLEVLFVCKAVVFLLGRDGRSGSFFGFVTVGLGSGLDIVTLLGFLDSVDLSLYFGFKFTLAIVTSPSLMLGLSGVSARTDKLQSAGFPIKDSQTERVRTLGLFVIFGQVAQHVHLGHLDQHHGRQFRARLCLVRLVHVGSQCLFAMRCMCQSIGFLVFALLP